MEILFAKPGRMNLLGYLLRSRFQSRLADKKFQRRLSRIRRPLQIEAGGMKVFLLAREGNLVLSTEPFEMKACAGLRAELPAIIQFALRQRWLKSFLQGKIGIWGKPWRLLPLLGLLSPRSKR